MSVSLLDQPEGPRRTEKKFPPSQNEGRIFCRWYFNLHSHVTQTFLNFCCSWSGFLWCILMLLCSTQFGAGDSVWVLFCSWFPTGWFWDTLYTQQGATRNRQRQIVREQRKEVGCQGTWLVLCPFKKVILKNSAYLLGRCHGPAILTILSRCFVTTRGHAIPVG